MIAQGWRGRDLMKRALIDRETKLLELKAALDGAEADLASGAYTDYTNATLPQLAEELGREARQLRSERQRDSNPHPI
jgi:hypothetical protein